MPTLPWCVGPMLGVVQLSSEIPQAPTDSNPNEIEIQDSTAGSSGMYIVVPILYFLFQAARRLVCATP